MEYYIQVKDNKILSYSNLPVLDKDIINIKVSEELYYNIVSNVCNYKYYNGTIVEKSYEEKKEMRHERLQKYSMTKQDFFNHVLKPQGFTYDALMQIVDGSEDYKVAWNLCERVYRGDKNLIGAISKFLPKLTEEELDNLFEEYGA